MKRICSILLVIACTACGNTTEKDGDSNNTVVVNSDNGNNASNANGSIVSGDDCITRCAAKATACEFPGDSELVCSQQFCAGALTTTELECLEAASCQELAAADQTFCEDASNPNSSNPNSSNPNSSNPNSSSPNSSNPNSSNPNSSNPNNEPANNDEGGPCSCDPNPDYNGQDTIYGYCEGTETGCKYDLFGDGPKLGCLYEYKSGNGTCTNTCSADDEGSQGSCPDGDICANSGLRSLTGSFWYECG